MTTYGIRIRRPWWPKSRGWIRGRQFRRADTPSGWTYWRDEWPTEAAAKLRLNAYRAQGWVGHTFEIDELKLVGRDEWGARDPRGRVYDDWTDAPLVYHHTADHIAMTADRGDNIDHMKAMQHFHMFVRGWADVAYNFIVFPNGDVFVGRGFGVRGAGAADGTREWNTRYIHVAFAGDYRDRSVTPAASRAADQLEAYLRSRGARAKPEVGHGDLMPTSCPGEGVREDRKL